MTTIGPHLLGLHGHTREQFDFMLDTAQQFVEVSERPIKKVPTLRGRTIINLFLEPSTRTRTSFEIAAKRLSADAINIGSRDSSVSKGESLVDTAYTLQAMKPEIIVMRHEASGAAHFIASHMEHSVVVNAGDGLHEHPTQALLDALTIRQRLGRLDGLKFAFVGDIIRQRVVRSLIYLLTAYGAEVRAIAPPTLLPPELKELGLKLHYKIDEGLAGVDVVYVMRMKYEYLKDHFVPDLDEYSRHFIVSEPLLKRVAPNAVVMSPAPFNRGTEITSEVVDGPRSLVQGQVTNGVAVRMAVLYLLCTQHAHRFSKLPMEDAA